MSSGVNDMHLGLFLCTILLISISAVGGGECAPLQDDLSQHEWTVDQVVASLKEARASSVSFVETTYSSLLTVPLIARGVLRFSPPSTLEKEVRTPYRERYLIEGDRITFESERKHLKKIISLEDYPALRSLVEAFRASFTGDAARLKETYETRVDGDRKKWWLSLRPHESAGQSMVAQILLSGSEGRILTITVRSSDGDRSVMTLSRGSLP
jgi:Outer membrane lipoprotein carrier protein LolA-like